MTGTLHEFLYRRMLTDVDFVSQKSVYHKSKTVHTFTEQWNNNKYYYKEEYPGLNHVAMRPAEMQSTHSSYAVGYFQGSTERGEYSTIKETLGEVTNVTTEASWQVVTQKEVSNRIWEHATAKAIEAQKNKNHDCCNMCTERNFCD